MKTDDLITALSADAGMSRSPIARTVWVACAVGVVTAIVLSVALMPARPDIAEAVMRPRFLFKWALTLSLLVSAMLLVLQLARPQPVTRTQLWLLIAAPVVLAFGVGIEMMTHPASEWMPLLVGHNARFCVIFIPLLSALPLAAFIVALRQGATSNPVLAGAVAGLASAGIGTTLYAAHCMDDSPLFMAAWYVTGTLLMAGVGAYFGDRLLRW